MASPDPGPGSNFDSTTVILFDPRVENVGLSFFVVRVSASNAFDSWVCIVLARYLDRLSIQEEKRKKKVKTTFHGVKHRRSAHSAERPEEQVVTGYQM